MSPKDLPLSVLHFGEMYQLRDLGPFRDKNKLFALNWALCDAIQHFQ